MELIYAIGIRIVNFLIVFEIVILLPGLPPKTTFPFKPFSVSPVKDLKGALELNYHLDGGERLLNGRLYGPECLIARKNEIYTGIQGGEVIKLTAEHVTHVAKFGQPCEDIYEEHRCGRPLGLAFDTIGNNLIVADSYYGIWQVDLSNGKKKLLISPHQELDGNVKRPAKIFNSVAVDRIGNIYWTDSSSDFSIEDIVYSIFSNPSGRLFYYDRNANSSKVLLDELFFPNGVVIGPNEEFVVVAETGASRLLKYYIKGSKAGKHEVFVDGLPGNPDNLTPDEEGIWVPLVAARDTDHPSLFTIMSEFPNLRMFIARVMSIFEGIFLNVNNIFPNKLCQKFIHFTGHGEVAAPFLPKRATIVRVDWNGNILGSLHGFDKSVGHISHVLELNEHLYLGSPYNRFLARVKSPKPPQVKIRNVRYEGLNLEPMANQGNNNEKPKAPKQTTESPTTAKPTTKPTTTTARPTTTTRKPTTSTTEKPTTTTSKPETVSSSAKTSESPQKEKLTSTTTSKPPTTTTTSPSLKPKQVPKNPAPVKENRDDIKPPPQEKLKIIKKGGKHTEL